MSGLLLIFSGIGHLLLASSQGIQRISLGSSSLEGDSSSFHVNLSENGRYATFQSFANNWHPDDPNTFKQDVFLRDELTNETIQITFGEDDSFDATISADGRFVAFTSYAGDLVPNDNNTTSIWIRDGLDVFLYDSQTGGFSRVSLTDRSQEIKGNSIGIITPDGNYIVFLSNGNNVIYGVENGPKNPALYIRNWRTGEIKRITHELNNPTGFPNGELGNISVSHDNRYIVYTAEASNLVPNDNNGESDIFLYDQQSGITKRISEPSPGINANGASNKAQISDNGEYIAFHSTATNLVPNDTNGEMDVFVYTIATGEIELISISTAGVQGNGLSREPSICANGRFIAYTTAANNLFSNDTNGQRDIMVRDRWLNETFVVSKNESGELANGKAHRVLLSKDCRTVAFASDADNLIPNDHNDARDIFTTTLIFAEFGPPLPAVEGEKAAGEEITVSYAIQNEGTEAGTAVFSVDIPQNLTYVPNSVTGGAAHNGGTIEWSGSVAAEATKIITFRAVIDAGLTDFSSISFEATVNAVGQQYVNSFSVPINGREIFLPIVNN